MLDNHGAESALLLDKLLSLTRSQACQVSYIANNEVISHAGGTTIDGQPYEISSLAPGYCMSRIPLLAAVMVLADNRDLDVDEQISHYVTLPFLHPLATIADVLDHRAGLASPNLVAWRMADRHHRASLLPANPLAISDGYSDLLPGLAIAALIEKVASLPAADFIQEMVISAAGATDLCTYAPVPTTVNPPVAGLPATIVPLLSERLADQVDDIGPATGVFTCAEGLALILDWLFLTEREPSRLDQFLRRSEATFWDPILNRSASYTLGFMSRLGDSGLAGASSQAFGHTAAIAGWLAIVDPLSRTVKVGYSNGVLLGAEDGALTRNAILAILNDDLDRLGQVHEYDAEPPVLQGRHSAAEPFEGLAQHIGKRLLPRDCTFTLGLCLDGQGTALLIEDGALTCIVTPTGEDVLDLTLTASRECLGTWFSDPDSRLGALLSSGSVTADGSFWYLSAVDYWADKAARLSHSRTAPP